MLKQLFESHADEFNEFESQASRWSTIFLAFFGLIVIVGKLAQNQGFNLADFSAEFVDVGLDPNAASGFAATGFLFLSARPTERSFKFFAALGLILGIIFLTNFVPEQANAAYFVVVSGPGFALAGILGLIYQAVAAKVLTARKRARTMLRFVGILILYPSVGQPSMTLLSWSTPEVYDAFGYLVEGCLGIWPCNEVALLLGGENSLLGLMFAGIYSRLLLFVGLAFAVNIIANDRCYSNSILTFVVSGLVAWCFYPILPMVGPDDFLGTAIYPSSGLPVDIPLKTVVAPPHLPRTCFPSMHGTWILLPFLTVRRVHKGWAWFFGIIAFLTIISTMLGRVGHYSIDLVASFPFAVGFMALSARRTDDNKNLRWVIAGVCFSFVIFMGLGIRLFSETLASFPATTWTVFMLAIFGSLWLEEVLAQASLGAVEPDGGGVSASTSSEEEQ